MALNSFISKLDLLEPNPDITTKGHWCRYQLGLNATNEPQVAAGRENSKQSPSTQQSRPLPTLQQGHSSQTDITFTSKGLKDYMCKSSSIPFHVCPQLNHPHMYNQLKPFCDFLSFFPSLKPYPTSYKVARVKCGRYPAGTYNILQFHPCNIAIT